MNPERWRQIEALFEPARELKPSERSAFLAEACKGDEGLRHEVESLLAQDASLLDKPLWERAPETSTGTATVISAGTRFGPYEIDRLIGAGGMGQVFRAVDTRLNRSVAIKTPADAFGERFMREARSIAQLNHPHICTLYDVGPNYLVMELLEGETLADRLKKGPLPQDRVFKFGAQIADALAAAHSKGIVHRDLKPANIMITTANAKVLDFGIAKSAHDEALTVNRQVIGTPAYMSPEQREGKECDARSDIYSLGLVLREMATGSRAGDLVNTPPHFAHIVTRCLESDSADRWQAASDVRRELEWTAGITPPAPPLSRLPYSRIAWIIAAVAFLGLLIGVTVFYRRRSGPSLVSSQFILTLNQQSEEIGSVPIPSPDGEFLAFPSKNLGGVTSIWIRPLNSVAVQQLSGTEGSEGDLAWSTDGRWIAFYADGKLKKIRAAGGPPETIAAIAGFQDAAWGSKGDIIFRPTNRAPLFRIRDSSGPPHPLTKLNALLTENSHRFPTFLPDGQRFLFVSRCADRANDVLYLGSLDSPGLKKIMPAEARASYIPGALLFYRDGALIAQRFDPDRSRLSGDPVPVLPEIAYSAPSLLAAFRVSADGGVIAAASANSAGANMVWYSRNGEEIGRLGNRGQYWQPRISPDGSRVAFESPDPQTGNRDIWYIEIARGITSRLTTNVANDWYPVWSPDGRQLAFASDRDSGARFLPYLKTSLDPGSSESPLNKSTDGVSDWSRDGQWMAFSDADISVARASKADSPFLFLATPAKETGARFSPDSRWIAYISNESGRSEIYVRPFSGGPAGPSGKVQISSNGGEYPVWGPSGEELYYMSADSSIYAADMRGLGRAASVPPPTLLFPACPGTGALGPPLAGQTFNHAFDTHDGKKFLVVCRAELPGRFTVLTNWKFPQ